MPADIRDQERPEILIHTKHVVKIAAGVRRGFVSHGKINARNHRQPGGQQRSLNLPHHLGLTLKVRMGLSKLIAQHKILSRSPKQTGLPMHARDHGVINRLPDGNEQRTRVEPLAVVVLRHAEECSKSLKIEVARIIRAKPRRQIIDDHGLVRVRDLTEDAAAEQGQFLSVGPRIGTVGHAG